MTAPHPTAAVLPDRWFRTRPDSSVHDRPRLLARSLIDAADLDDHIAFYERLLAVPADLRMPIPDFGGLELAAVGNLLLIASVRPFTPIQRRTAYSLIVPSLTAQLETVRAAGGTVLEPPEDILPGARARVRYPDDAVAELVEHRPQPGETPAPSRTAPPDGGSRPAPRLLVRRQVPRADFHDAVALYEKVLETSARPHAGPNGHDLDVAVIGNLLLVGKDGRDPAADAATAVALPAPHPRQLVEASAPTGSRALIPLPDGGLAEVWDSTALGL
ncbi:VOC family protein [Streptomyces tubercidicus]